MSQRARNHHLPTEPKPLHTSPTSLPLQIMPVYTLFQTDNTVEVLEINREDQKPRRLVEHLRQIIVDQWLEIYDRFRIGRQACTIFVAENGAGRKRNFLINQALIDSATKSNYNGEYLNTWGHLRLRGDIVVKTAKPIERKYFDDSGLCDTSSDESE